MTTPILQVALDHIDLASAMRSARILADHVDVLEVGTILCFAEGARAIEVMRAVYPEHIILADFKTADAGAVLADMVFSRGATWMTCICSAPLATMDAALKIAKKSGGDIQVELYGDWTFKHAEQWKSIGLTQVVYHRGRDAAAAGQTWGEGDLKKIRQLTEMGMDVSVTGGLSPEDIQIFKGIPVKSFISGRSLYGADNPAEVAKDFKKTIAEYWS